MALNFEERGMYRELLDHQWLHGSVPADFEAMTDAMAAGRMADGTRVTADRIRTMWPRLAGFFTDLGDGRLANLKLERIRGGRTAFVTAKSRGGKASAEARRVKFGTAQPNTRPNTTPNSPPNSADSVRGTDAGTHSPKQAENVAVTEQPPKLHLQIASAVPSVQNTEGGGAADLFRDQEIQTSVDALVAIWNTEREPGPKVMRQLPQARRQAIQRALKIVPNLEDWRTAIRFLNTLDWANASGRGDHPTWRATLDWLVKPGKCADYLERARLDKTTRKGDTARVGRDTAKGRTGFEPGKYATTATAR